MARTLLVFGFAPFGGDARNPSGEIAESLDGRTIGGMRVRALVAPVARARAFATVRRAIAETRPAAIVGLGVADGRSAVSVERRAVNREDGRDEAGDERSGEPIVAGGTAELLATVDPEALTAAIRAGRVPAQTSDDAGTFLCNHVYYRVLRDAGRVPAARRPGVVFLHLPALPETVAARGGVSASMALGTTRRGVLAALRFVARSGRGSRGLVRG